MEPEQTEQTPQPKRRGRKPKAEPKPEAWEYERVETARFTDVQMNAHLQERGDDGWELISIDRGVYVFKRRKA